MTTSASFPVLGVCIVAYNAADVITGCLATLLVADNVQLRIVVVDNASSDDTTTCIRNWAAGTIAAKLPLGMPFDPPNAVGPITLREMEPGGSPCGDSMLTMLHAPANGGFAAGVNLGLDYLMQFSDIDRFWVLNPDCLVPPRTPAALATQPVPPNGFALMGGRVSYLSPVDVIQSDGGRINWLTGMTVNVNRGRVAAHTSPPAAGTLDFISGASLVASRIFLEQAGPIPEDYFLYYEEVDWALRRGALSLVYCDNAPVYHHAGSAIGSGSLERVSTDFSVYFLYRARMRFLRRHCPWCLPAAYLYALAKMGQHTLRREWSQAYALIRAINGLRPPAAVRSRLSPEAAALAFAQ